VNEGSDLAAGRDVLDPQRRKDGQASTTEGPGQPPGHRQGPAAAQLHRGAVRGHARPARRPDRSQLPDSARPARPLGRCRVDEVRAPLGRAAAVRLADEPRLEHRRLALSHLATQPRSRPPHRGGHKCPPPPRTPAPARRVEMRARACQGLRLPLRVARPPPRRRPVHPREDGGRGRAHPQEPQAARTDRARRRHRLRPGLVLRRAAAGAGPTRIRGRRALLQRHRPPLPAARGRPRWRRADELTPPIAVVRRRRLERTRRGTAVKPPLGRLPSLRS